MSEQLVLGGQGRNAQDRKPLGDGLRGTRGVHVAGEPCPVHWVCRFGGKADQDSAEHGLRSYGE